MMMIIIIIIVNLGWNHELETAFDIYVYIYTHMLSNCFTLLSLQVDFCWLHSSQHDDHRCEQIGYIFPP